MTNPHTIIYSPVDQAAQLPGPHLWLLDFSRLDHCEEAHCLPLLSSEERERAAQYRRGQREFILCRALVRLCLARYAGVDPHALRFDKNPSGKPYLTGEHNHWQFNLSHSGQHAALTVIRHARIGLDIEQPRKRNFLGIAKEYFHPGEVAWLQALPSAQLPHEFFRLWTLKEAFFKALGGGIAMGLHRAVFAGEEHKSGHHFAEDLREREKDWQFYHTQLQLPQLTYVALAYNAPAAQLHWFDASALFD